MIRINDILDKVAENNPEADLDIIDRAYIFSARVHDGQVRLSGDAAARTVRHMLDKAAAVRPGRALKLTICCLLYTSDAADERG